MAITAATASATAPGTARPPAADPSIRLRSLVNGYMPAVAKMLDPTGKLQANDLDCMRFQDITRLGFIELFLRQLKAASAKQKESIDYRALIKLLNQEAWTPHQIVELANRVLAMRGDKAKADSALKIEVDTLKALGTALALPGAAGLETIRRTSFDENTRKALLHLNIRVLGQLVNKLSPISQQAFKKIAGIGRIIQKALREAQPNLEHELKAIVNDTERKALMAQSNGEVTGLFFLYNKLHSTGIYYHYLLPELERNLRSTSRRTLSQAQRIIKFQQRFDGMDKRLGDLENLTAQWSRVIRLNGIQPQEKESGELREELFKYAAVFFESLTTERWQNLLDSITKEHPALASQVNVEEGNPLRAAICWLLWESFGTNCSMLLEQTRSNYFEETLIKNRKRWSEENLGQYASLLEELFKRLFLESKPVANEIFRHLRQLYPEGYELPTDKPVFPDIRFFLMEQVGKICHRFKTGTIIWQREIPNEVRLANEMSYVCLRISHELRSQTNKQALDKAFVNAICESDKKRPAEWQQNERVWIHNLDVFSASIAGLRDSTNLVFRRIISSLEPLVKKEVKENHAYDDSWLDAIDNHVEQDAVAALPSVTKEADEVVVVDISALAATERRNKLLAAYPSQATRCLALFRQKVMQFYCLDERIVHTPLTVGRGCRNPIQLARYQHAFALDMLLTIVEMFERSSNEQSRVLLANLLFFLGHLANEQALTVEYLKKHSEEELTHFLYDLVTALNVGQGNAWINEDCGGTICVRYPASLRYGNDSLSLRHSVASIEDAGQATAKEVMDGRNWILQEAMRLQCQGMAQSCNPRQSEILDSIPAMLKEDLSKCAVEGIAEDDAKWTDDSAKLLEGMHGRLQTATQALTKHISGLPPSESTKALRNVLYHLRNLSRLPQLVQQFPQKRFMALHFYTAFFSTQYLAENLGVYLSLQQNLELRDHNLEAYQKAFGLGNHLDATLKNLLAEINVGKGSEYVYTYFAKHPTTFSALMSKFSGLYAHSRLAAMQREGIEIPQDQSKEASSAFQQNAIIRDLERLCSLSLNLLQGHIIGNA